MTVVLDVSAAIDVVLRKDAYIEFSEVIGKADVVIAPEIYISEISNVAWKYHKLANYSQEQSSYLAETGILIIDKFVPVADLWKEALQEAILNDHSVYDLLYLVCARRSNGVLLTRDKKLITLCSELHVRTLLQGY